MLRPCRQQQVAALHERTPGGLTALHWAAMCNVGPQGKRVVRRLVDAHAEPSARTKRGSMVKVAVLAVPRLATTGSSDCM